MTSTRLTFLTLALLALAACGKGGGDASASSAAAAAHPSDEALLKIQDTVPEGFEKTSGGKVVMGSIMPNYTAKEATPKGIKPQIVLMLGRCNPALCPEEQSAKGYGAKKDRLPHAMMLSKAVKEDPKLVHEFGEATVAGEKVVTVYVASHVERQTKQGGTSRTARHEFNLYWHNGTTFMRVSTHAFGSAGKMGDRAAFFELYPKADMQAAAEKHFAFVLEQLRGTAGDAGAR